MARDRDFEDVVVHRKAIDSRYVVVKDGLERDGLYYWKVLAVNEAGRTENRDGPRILRIDAERGQSLLAMRENGLMASSALDGDGTPSFGTCEHEQGLLAAADRTGRRDAAVAFDGKASELRYRLAFFPQDDYSFTAWIRPAGLPARGLQQVFSAWCKSGDDPLRITLEGERLFARIENPKGGCGTRGVPVENGRWVHVAAVKQGTSLTLYVDGSPAHSVGTHRQIRSDSTAIGLGFNPMYAGGEHFAGAIDGFAFYARALTPEEIAALYRSVSPVRTP